MNAVNQLLPVGWRRAPLGEVVEILDRLRVPVNADEREKRPGPVPYYGATGQVGWIDKHLFDEELVLLGEDGAPVLDPAKSKAYLIKGKAWVNNHAHVLRGAGVSNAFLMHQLNALDYHGAVTGTTRLKLPQAPMKKLSLVVPPRFEQDRIVAEIEKQFTRLDAGVEALKRLQAHLRRYRATVLKAACEGRLVPTEASVARTEGRVYESGETLLKRVLSARRALHEASGSRRRHEEPASPVPGAVSLPEGWTWATVEQLSSQVDYGSSSKTSEEPVGVPVLRMGNIRDGHLDTSNLKYLPTNHHEFPALLLRDGDVLFNRTNSPELVGKTAVYRGQPTPCSFASYLIRARLIEGYSPHLLAAFINSLYGREWIKRVVVQQVGQANVNGSKLQSLAIPVPPAREQARIVTALEEQLSEVAVAEKVVERVLARTARLRAAVLRSAFEGQL